MDYEFQSCTRRCAATGRELAPGEAYYSALVPDGEGWQRLDYAVEAWQGPPPEAIGWWKSQRPDARRAHWAPNDVLLDFFDRLEGQAENQDMRYVLALLLVRRRVMRLEETQTDEHGRETLVLYCPRRETTHQVPVIVPDEARANQLQEQLARLLQ
jgi:uncharacterized protein YbaR (Trm112 family)